MKSPDSSIAPLSDAFEYLVDPKVGIIRIVEEIRPESGAPNFFHFAAQACNTGAFNRQKNFAATGGAATDRARAIAKAVGEAVERYCAALYDINDLPLATSASLTENHVAPGEFALYSDEQYQQAGFPWVKFGDQAQVRWTDGLDLTTGEPCSVPAAFVYVPYHFYRGTGDSPIVQPISTGLACHTHPLKAALSGIYEVIERDAFMITWQARLGMPRIRVETLSDEAYDLAQRFDQTGASVALFDLTLDHGIPTILSVLRTSSPGGPALVFAAAASLNPELAVRSALEELAHTRRYSQQIRSRMPRLVTDPDYSNVIDQMDHLNLYCDHGNAPLADFIFSSPQRKEFDLIENHATGDLNRDLETVIQRIKSIGHRIILCDLTTADVRDLGFTVVRAVIPGFHPLFMGHPIRALGGKRLWEVPQWLHYGGITRESGDNPAPHPYP